jgi:hypothetical protein
MEIHTTLDTPASAAGLNPVGGPLPALVVGERAEATRKHEWPGRLFIGLSALAALGVGCMAIVSAVWGVNGDPNPALGVAGGVWAVVQWRLTREVRRFTRGGW